MKSYKRGVHEVLGSCSSVKEIVVGGCRLPLHLCIKLVSIGHGEKALETQWGTVVVVILI